MLVGHHDEIAYIGRCDDADRSAGEVGQRPFEELADQQRARLELLGSGVEAGDLEEVGHQRLEAGDVAGQQIEGGDRPFG